MGQVLLELSSRGGIAEMTNLTPFDFLIDCSIASRRTREEGKRRCVGIRIGRDRSSRNYHSCHFISTLLIAELRCEERNGRMRFWWLIFFFPHRRLSGISRIDRDESLSLAIYAEEENFESDLSMLLLTLIASNDRKMLWAFLKNTAW